MMQMPCKCDVPNLFWEIHKICHEAPLKKHWWKIRLLNGELLLFDRRNYGLRQRLGILFLYHSLHIFSVYLLCGRIVLLVFVQYNSIQGPLI
jgi:hypothetical protein